MSLNLSVQPAVPRGAKSRTYAYSVKCTSLSWLCSSKTPRLSRMAPPCLNNRRFVWKPAFAESVPTGVVRLSGSPHCVETSEDIQNPRRGYMRRLSKVTGDQSQDVVTIPSSQRGTQRRFESENPRGTANSTPA